MRKLAASAAFLLALSSVYLAAQTHSPGKSHIDAEKIRANVKFLSSDLLEGRGMAQRGSDLAAEYIATQFALDGLKPAGDHGTYFQEVPMVAIATLPSTTFSLVPATGDPSAAKKSRRLRHSQRNPNRFRRHRRAHRLRRLRHHRAGI